MYVAGTLTFRSLQGVSPSGIACSQTLGLERDGKQRPTSERGGKRGGTRNLWLCKLPLTCLRQIPLFIIFFYSLLPCGLSCSKTFDHCTMNSFPNAKGKGKNYLRQDLCIICICLYRYKCRIILGRNREVEKEISLLFGTFSHVPPYNSTGVQTGFVSNC